MNAVAAVKTTHYLYLTYGAGDDRTGDRLADVLAAELDAAAAHLRAHPEGAQYMRLPFLVVNNVEPTSTFKGAPGEVRYEIALDGTLTRRTLAADPWR